MAEPRTWSHIITAREKDADVPNRFIVTVDYTNGDEGPANNQQRTYKTTSVAALEKAIDDQQTQFNTVELLTSDDSDLAEIKVGQPMSLASVRGRTEAPVLTDDQQRETVRRSAVRDAVMKHLRLRVARAIGYFTDQDVETALKAAQEIATTADADLFPLQVSPS